MDTLTHTLSGVGLAFVAQAISPGIDEVTLGLIGFGVLASNAPDFDVVTKGFGNYTFINNHRGLTHTVFAWPILAAPMALLFSLISLANIGFMPLFIFALASIALHVFLDVFNSYGTMILAKGKWVRLSVTHTFDPVITSALILGIISSFLYRDIEYMFLYFLLGILVYMLLRVLYKRVIIKNVRNAYPNAKRTIIIATSKPYRWYVAIDNGNEYHTFRIIWKEVLRLNVVKKQNDADKYMHLLENDKIYHLFTKFSPMYNSHMEGDHLLLTDMRYRKAGYFYFKATFIIRDGKIASSYVGWVFNENSRIDKVEARV